MSVVIPDVLIAPVGSDMSTISESDWAFLNSDPGHFPIEVDISTFCAWAYNAKSGTGSFVVSNSVHPDPPDAVTDFLRTHVAFTYGDNIPSPDTDQLPPYHLIPTEGEFKLSQFPVFEVGTGFPPILIYHFVRFDKFYLDIQPIAGDSTVTIDITPTTISINQTYPPDGVGNIQISDLVLTITSTYFP
jgi:hypothetical protein